MSLSRKLLEWHPTEDEAREWAIAAIAAGTIVAVALNACPVAYAIWCLLS